MQKSDSVDVVIVGQGAIGAASALALARLGLRVAQLAPGASPERAAPMRPPPDDWDTRVFALSQATRTLLSGLGVWEALDPARLAPVHDMRVYPGAGASELHLDAYRARVEALAWIVENRQLMRALGEACRYAGVTVWDDRLVDLTADPPGPSGRAVLGLGSGRVLRARLVVAADGADSTLRRLAGIEPSIDDYPQRAVVANFETPGAHADTAWQWFGPQGVLALLPLPAADSARTRLSMVWSAPQDLAEELAQLSGQALADRVSETIQTLPGAPFAQLRSLGPAQAFALRRIRVGRLVAPRVVLAGDAAHGMHPLAGQGMNVGFGDVAGLLQVLRGREPFRDIADPLLLRRYERARREPVVLMQEITHGLQRLFDLPAQPWAAPVAALRDAGWRLVARSGWLRNRLVRQAMG